MKAITVYLALCIISAVTALSQDVPDQSRPVTYFKHVDPGQPSIIVNVWGDINAAGRYEVREGTGLLELIFLAGGPGEKVQNSREHRHSDILLSRKEGDVWKLITRLPLDDLMMPTQPDVGLQNEDIIKIETHVSAGFSWKDALTIIGTVGTLALIGDRILK